MKLREQWSILEAPWKVRLSLRVRQARLQLGILQTSVTIMKRQFSRPFPWRGKAPPVKSFTEEESPVHWDDWLPTLE